jgi:SAM-dependent methyltransferase
LCSDVRTLPPDWTDRFDIVFTSYGVLPWLPDLAGWATGIARVLRPGGSFHIVEFHPITAMLDDEGKHLSQPYFHTPQAARYEVAGSYADPDASFTHPAFEWAYSLSDVITALIDAGLRIRAFREYPFSPYDCFPYLEEQSAGRWTVRGAQVQLPLLFSIHADRVAP